MRLPQQTIYNLYTSLLYEKDYKYIDIAHGRSNTTAIPCPPPIHAAPT